MATNATHPALGSLLYDNSGSGNYVVLASQILEIDPPPVKVGSSKTTNLASTGRFHTYQSGWIDGDTVKCKVNFLTADNATLTAIATSPPGPPGTGAANSNSSKNFRVRYNDGSALTTGSQMNFIGFITEVGDSKLSRDSDDVIMTEITIKVSGPVTWVASS